MNNYPKSIFAPSRDPHPHIKREHFKRLVQLNPSHADCTQYPHFQARNFLLCFNLWTSLTGYFSIDIADLFAFLILTLLTFVVVVVVAM